jgi:hypothetical protein
MNFESRKIEKKFAIIPTILSNGKLIWLKRYNVEFEWKDCEKILSLPFGLPWNRINNNGYVIYTEKDWSLVRKFI